MKNSIMQFGDSDQMINNMFNQLLQQKIQSKMNNSEKIYLENEIYSFVRNLFTARITTGEDRYLYAKATLENVEGESISLDLFKAVSNKDYDSVERVLTENELKDFSIRDIASIVLYFMNFRFIKLLVKHHYIDSFEFFTKEEKILFIGEIVGTKEIQNYEILTSKFNEVFQNELSKLDAESIPAAKELNVQQAVYSKSLNCIICDNGQLNMFCSNPSKRKLLDGLKDINPTIVENFKKFIEFNDKFNG